MTNVITRINYFHKLRKRKKKIETFYNVFANVLKSYVGNTDLKIMSY